MSFGGARVLAHGVQELDARRLVISLLHVALAALQIRLGAAFAPWEKEQRDRQRSGDQVSGDRASPARRSHIHLCLAATTSALGKAEAESLLIFFSSDLRSPVRMGTNIAKPSK